MKSFIWSNPKAIKLVVNWKNGNDATIFEYTLSSVFLTLFLLSSLVIGSGHGNIITGSGFMTISLYKGLTRNPKIGNTPL